MPVSKGFITFRFNHEDSNRDYYHTHYVFFFVIQETDAITKWTEANKNGRNIVYHSSVGRVEVMRDGLYFIYSQMCFSGNRNQDMAGHRTFINLEEKMTTVIGRKTHQWPVAIMAALFIWMRLTQSPWSQQRLVNTTCQKRAHFSESSLSRTTRKRQVIFLYWELSQILLFENSLTRVKTLTTISISDVISATQY